MACGALLGAWLHNPVYYSDSARAKLIDGSVGPKVPLAAMEQPAPLFDSLPYYDNDLEVHPILREKVQHELAVETQKIQQEALHPRVPPPVELFVVSESDSTYSIQLFQALSVFSQNNPLLSAELQRVEARKPLVAIDTSRYQLTSSLSMPSTDEGWKSSLDGAYAQLEHQRIRYCLAICCLVSKLTCIKAQQPCSASTIW
jgi:Breast carcinoma amplified sequence 2 (BCAS2)